jgi:hypothetical protein
LRQWCRGDHASRTEKRQQLQSVADDTIALGKPAAHEITPKTGEGALVPAGKPESAPLRPSGELRRRANVLEIVSALKPALDIRRWLRLRSTQRPP